MDLQNSIWQYSDSRDTTTKWHLLLNSKNSLCHLSMRLHNTTDWLFICIKWNPIILGWKYFYIKVMLHTKQFQDWVGGSVPRCYQRQSFLVDFPRDYGWWIGIDTADKPSYRTLVNYYRRGLVHKGWDTWKKRQRERDCSLRSLLQSFMIHLEHTNWHENLRVHDVKFNYHTWFYQMSIH